MINIFDTMIRTSLVGRTIMTCDESTLSDEGVKLTLDDGTILEVSFVGGYGKTTVVYPDGSKATKV